ncbi:MAG TPA: thioredoxin domain-containing protein [Bacteriovoracaceae bacterium]|nr:thioredoxin domain-containing protein [Bacteriovoracaceae bacterium]
MHELTDETIFEVIEKEPLVLIDFYASWCGACRIAAPMFNRVATEEGIKIFKIDVEKNPKIKEMIELPGLPSVGCFKNGEPLDLVNVTKEDVFREFVKKMKG